MSAQLGFLFEEQPPPTPADPHDLVPSDSRWATLFAIGNQCNGFKRQLDKEPHYSDFLNERLTPEGKSIWNEIRRTALEFERERKRIEKVYGTPCMQKACMEYWAERFRRREAQQKETTK